MVEIKIIGEMVRIELRGLHRLWALKRSLTIRKSGIRSVMLTSKDLRPAPLRCPGTYLPGIIAAGTFYGKGRKEFWDTVFKNQSIEILLNDEKYTRIVVDVNDPLQVIEQLKPI